MRAVASTHQFRDSRDLLASSIRDLSGGAELRPPTRAGEDDCSILFDRRGLRGIELSRKYWRLAGRLVLAPAPQSGIVPPHSTGALSEMRSHETAFIAATCRGAGRAAEAVPKLALRAFGARTLPDQVGMVQESEGTAKDPGCRSNRWIHGPKRHPPDLLEFAVADPILFCCGLTPGSPAATSLV